MRLLGFDRLLGLHFLAHHFSDLRLQLLLVPHPAQGGGKDEGEEESKREEEPEVPEQPLPGERSEG